MRLLLMQPGTLSSQLLGSQGWLLAAEELRDPAGWTPGHLCASSSDRLRFETAVRDLDPRVGLVLRRERRGLCVLEYDWSQGEDVVRDHATRIARMLGVELQVGGTLTPPGRVA